MTFSSEKRTENCLELLRQMLKMVGEKPVDQTFFDPTDSCFSAILPTTWDALGARKWIEGVSPLEQYRLTGEGWLGAMKFTDQLDSFMKEAGKIIATMKSYVKGRTKAMLVSVEELAERSGISAGLVFNLIESRVLERRYGKCGASWYGSSGRMVFIPRDFGIEPLDLDKLFKEDAEIRLRELESEIDATKEELSFTKDELSRFQCPYCGAPLSYTAPIELDERTSDTVEAFECGYTIGAGSEQPCPSDPRFPKLEDYDFKFKGFDTKWGTEWVCYPVPKTDMARRIHLMNQAGRTQEEAKQNVIRWYEQHAKPWKRRL
ncbi:MAG: hypothetical protein O7A06_09915 [Acidobacteria bacterium]|nr:hypothetical protein [Acidobacteriota bacterium]